MDTNKPRLAFNQSELNLVKATFAENEELLRIIRKAFLGGEMTEAQANTLKSTFEGKEELQKLVSIFFLPIVRDETPLGMGLDMWNGLQISDKDIHGAYYLILSREKTIGIIEKALQVIFSGSGTSGYENLLAKGDKEEMYLNIITRQSVSGHVNQKTMELLTLAGTKQESTEETVARLWKNSSK